MQVPRLTRGAGLPGPAPRRLRGAQIPGARRLRPGIDPALLLVPALFGIGGAGGNPLRLCPRPVQVGRRTSQLGRGCGCGSVELWRRGWRRRRCVAAGVAAADAGAAAVDAALRKDLDPHRTDRFPTLGVGLGFREPFRARCSWPPRRVDFLEVTADHYLDASAGEAAASWTCSPTTSR